MIRVNNERKNSETVSCRANKSAASARNAMIKRSGSWKVKVERKSGRWRWWKGEGGWRGERPAGIIYLLGGYPGRQLWKHVEGA